jgi:hypothetical protein
MTDTAPFARREPTLTPEQRQNWVINRQGKDFVLYAALLEIAHNQFQLSGIRTKLVQIPGPENGHVAICTAEVDVAHGTFCGTGDASPENVSRQMATVLIRFAETRAKARALRDAINASAWEVEGDPDHDEKPTVQPTMAEAKREFDRMLREPDNAPVPSLRPPQAPRGPGLTTRQTDKLADELDPSRVLAEARAKWHATVKIAEGLGVVVPKLEEAEWNDAFEIRIEGKKLGAAIRRKQEENAAATGA